MFYLLHTENNVLFANKVRARSPGLGWKLFNHPVEEALHGMCPHLNLIKTKRTRICSCTQGSREGEREQTSITVYGRRQLWRSVYGRRKLWGGVYGRRQLWSGVQRRRQLWRTVYGRLPIERVELIFRPCTGAQCGACPKMVRMVRMVRSVLRGFGRLRVERVHQTREVLGPM